MTDPNSNGIAITSGNRGPSVEIATWIIMVAMILTTMAKIASKLIMIRKLQVDDFLMGAAVVVTVGQVIAVSIQVDAGLGTRKSDISKLEKFERAEYASQTLYILALGLAKSAVFQFLFFLARTNFRRRLIKIAMSINILWTLIALVCIAIQCRLPKPWQVVSGKCFNQVAFWDIFGTVDILIDASTVLLPSLLLHDIHLRFLAKLSIIGAFAIRLLTIPLIILRLIYISRAFDSPDRPYTEFRAVLVTEIHLNVGIITACIPFLKPVMDSLQTGLLTSELKTMGRYAQGHRPNHALNSIGKSFTPKRKTRQHSWSHGDYSTRIESGGDIFKHESDEDVSEMPGLMTINQTTTIVVEGETKASRAGSFDMNIQFRC